MRYGRTPLPREVWLNHLYIIKPGEDRADDFLHKIETFNGLCRLVISKLPFLLGQRLRGNETHLIKELIFEIIKTLGIKRLMILQGPVFCGLAFLRNRDYTVKLHIRESFNLEHGFLFGAIRVYTWLRLINFPNRSSLNGNVHLKKLPKPCM